METKRYSAPKLSKELAEFCGIILGDGGISKSQVRITLHGKDDKEFIAYVCDLIMSLFNIQPALYTKPNDAGIDICVSRVALVMYCVEKLGLVKGNKIAQQVSVPDWILSTTPFKIACVRGLVDTDGSVFIHRYKVAGRWYAYKKLSFSSCSRPLIIFVAALLTEHGMHPRITKNRKEIRLDSVADMKRYFKIIGSHNQKHLKKWENAL